MPSVLIHLAYEGDISSVRYSAINPVVKAGIRRSVKECRSANTVEIVHYQDCLVSAAVSRQTYAHGL